MVKIRQMAPLYEIKLLSLVRIGIQCLDVCKNRVNIFGSVLDIRQNAEWPRFLAHPVDTQRRVYNRQILRDYRQLTATFALSSTVSATCVLPIATFPVLHFYCG